MPTASGLQPAQRGNPPPGADVGHLDMRATWQRSRCPTPVHLGHTDRVAGARGGRALLRGAYVDDDGVVRLEALIEGLVDELAERPVCRWCAVEVFQTWFRGRLTWAHRSTGLLVCSGQVIGGWEALREAAPLEWRLAR